MVGFIPDYARRLSGRHTPIRSPFFAQCLSGFRLLQHKTQHTPAWGLQISSQLGVIQLIESSKVATMTADPSPTSALPPSSPSPGRCDTIPPNASDIEEGRDAYRPGGFHPVYIGDVYHDRYEVLNKIGYGAYSTVWLVNDKKTPYVVPHTVGIVPDSAAWQKLTAR